MSAIVSASRWALRTAVDAAGKRRGWGVDFARAKFDQGGSGKPAAEINLLGKRGSISLRSHGNKRLPAEKTKSGRGHTWNLKNPGHLTIEERDSIDFPDGTRWAPEFGILSTDLVIDAPGENTWTFDLDLPGCKFAYQPELTAAEIAEGCSRPEWCVGSYAIFDGGLKVGHIARPFARDAAGRWTWGTISIAAGVATVAIDRAWMDGATYPVQVDPDIGYTSAGASSVATVANQLYHYNAGGGLGIATAMKMYCYVDPAASVTLGIYDGATGSKLADTAGGNTPTAAAWLTQNLDSSLTLTNGVQLTVSHNQDGSFNRYYDDDTNAMGRVSTATASTAYSAGSLSSPAPAIGIFGTVCRMISAYIVATDPVWPAAGDVRKDTVYGAASELTGTCYVPTAANTRYGINVDATTGALEIPNSGTPTGTQDATSDACVVSGKKYGSPQRTGSASSGGGVNMPRARTVGV